jgi:uncharacterized membrane protein
MYIIIGGDGKEYGPVSGEDLRKWIAEGRLNAQSLAKAEGDAEFRPLSAFPEFADAFAPHAPSPSAPLAFPTAAGLAPGDYDLDIGGCISRGWNLYKENFGILFVASLLLFVIQFVTAGGLNMVLMPLTKSLMHASVGFRIGYSYLLPAVTALVIGPMAGGVYVVYLKVIRQHKAGVGDAFAGFQKAFGQLYLGALAVGLIAGLCMLPFHYVFQSKAGPLLAQLQDAQAQHLAPADLPDVLRNLLHAFVGALPVLLICLIPVTYLTVSWMFTLPLIADRAMKFWPAMKTSFKMVNRHWWQVFGLFVLASLISIAGLLGCCIGILFTAPIGIAATMYAYETIFSRVQTG